MKFSMPSMKLVETRQVPELLKTKTRLCIRWACKWETLSVPVAADGELETHSHQGLLASHQNFTALEPPPRPPRVE